MFLKGWALSFLGQKDSITEYPLTSRQQKICCDIFTCQKMETGPEVKQSRKPNHHIINRSLNV